MTGRHHLRAATPGPASAPPEATGTPAPQDAWTPPDQAKPDGSPGPAVTTVSAQNTADPFPGDPPALTVMRDAATRRLRRIGAWSRRPAGRFLVPTLVITMVLAVTGTAGLYLTQAVSPLPLPSPSGSTAPGGSTDPDAAGNLPSADNPGPATNPSTNPGSAPPARPQDALAGWAQKVSPAVGIPAIALRAYGYAALRLASEQPGCHLAWTTLAAIGKVESDHGRAGGASPQPDGNVLPPIIGPALNGQGGLQTIADTDGGRYDGDRVYDHAVGPMQFIPGTWQRYQIDADRDGLADPNNINDATLAAAGYLCAGSRDLATAGGWWGAVLAYNAIQIYARNVFDAANDYGQRSRTVA